MDTMPLLLLRGEKGTRARSLSETFKMRHVEIAGKFHLFVVY